MLTLILLSMIGAKQAPRPLQAPPCREQCYNLGCQCSDCSGAACRCGTESKPKAVPLVRVCGPSGCSLVPANRSEPYVIEDPRTVPAFGSACSSGNCGVFTRRSTFSGE